MPNLSPYKILLADEDYEAREALAAALRSSGYDVSTAEHAIDAVFSLHRKVPDIVIYELNIPRVPGYDFLGVIRRRYPEVLVIAMSNLGDLARAADDIFADAVYVKGRSSPKALAETVTRLLHNSRLRAAMD